MVMPSWLPSVGHTPPSCSGAREMSRQHGPTPLSSYLHHQHSQLFLDGVLSFKGEDGTGQHAKPLYMLPSTSPLFIAIIIRGCPRQKCLGYVVHITTREDAFPQSGMLSMMETCHTHLMGDPQKDDQLKQGNRHITPPTERP